jgi:hypothetical protein
MPESSVDTHGQIAVEILVIASGATQLLVMMIAWRDLVLVF